MNRLLIAISLALVAAAPAATSYLNTTGAGWPAGDKSAFRTAAGLAIGTNVQAWDADLSTWAGVTPATGIGTFLAVPSGANLATALTSALPVSKGGTGLTTLGTGVATALGNPTNATGGLVGFSGALGTPTAGNFSAGTFTWPTFNQSTTGSAASVPASGITGTTLPAGVTASSLTSVGTLSSLTVSGQAEGIGQLAANANRYMTRGLADTRYKSVLADFDYSSTTSGLGISGSSGEWTWALPSGATALECVIVGSGSGGGSGRRGATSTARSGGGGGATGGVTRIWLPVVSLPSNTITVTVGLGGAGGAAITADDTNGAVGAAGTNSLIASSGSTIAIAYAPATSGAGGNTTTAAAGVAWSVGGTEIGVSGGAGQSTGSVSSSGGGGPVTPGGGGGGGGVTSGNVFIAGADSGVSAGIVFGGVNNSVRGFDGGANRNATAATLTAAWSPVGGGGAGGAGSVAGPGGSGGSGIRGGGGGGGGASLNGQASGAGGKGGDGFVRIIVHF